MVTAISSPNASYPNSAKHFVQNGDSMGFTNVMACVTIDGYNYDSRNSQPCHKGGWTGRSLHGTCVSKPAPLRRCAAQHLLKHSGSSRIECEERRSSGGSWQGRRWGRTNCCWHQQHSMLLLLQQQQSQPFQPAPTCSRAYRLLLCLALPHVNTHVHLLNR